MKGEMKNSMNLWRKESDLRMEFMKEDSEYKKGHNPILKLLYDYYTMDDSPLRNNSDQRIFSSLAGLSSYQPNRENYIRNFVRNSRDMAKKEGAKEMKKKNLEIMMNLEAAFLSSEENNSFLKEENKKLQKRLEYYESKYGPISNDNDEKDSEFQENKLEKQMPHNGKPLAMKVCYENSELT
ncbi:unnamed protein product [Moneuplotes crassus]|uniref:Uncharacterized protein n=1 Tax=Euplotes crassus TaxID=5936 RepID=A0AAD1Y8P2_EUPCR|nr:unnamed protein product [Moneuplotes crassus]